MSIKYIYIYIKTSRIGIPKKRHPNGGWFIAPAKYASIAGVKFPLLENFVVAGPGVIG